MQDDPQLRTIPIYRDFRIHAAQLPSGRWLSSLVRLGAKQRLTKDSLTATVTRVPGEFASEAEALEAAQHYINEEKARREE